MTGFFRSNANFRVSERLSGLKTGMKNAGSMKKNAVRVLLISVCKCLNDF